MFAISAFPAGSPRTRSLLGALALVAAGAAPATHAQSLGLGEAIRIATRDAPALTAQDAAIRAAREAGIGAGELPDPKLIVGVENLPAEGGDQFSFTRDFMTMRKIGVMQEFPREEKRELRGERAAAEIRRETAVRDATVANLRRDVALAWIDAWAAERQLTLLKDLEREFQLAVASTQAALAGGKGQASDAFMARQSAAQAGDRLIEARRGIDRARAQLARWVGPASARPLADAPDFTRLAHAHESLLAGLEAHPHLAMYGPIEAVAQAELKLAEAAKRPDWSLEVAYAQRGPAYTNMLSVMVRIDLPIFEAKRQNPMIAAKLAVVEQVRAQAEDARRAHLAEIRTWLADWHAAVERTRQFDAQQVPLARERSETALAAYRGGKGEIAGALEARRNEIETRLAHLMVTADAARAWAQLNFALPDPVSREPS
jgi:outer membrane protein, heavy metal efflux system